jgi:TonB-linked SusC/RagA family outer membrane protein
MRSWSSVRAVALLASLVALFGAPATASAQGSATVQGTVTDSVGSRPIAGVQVLVAGTTRGAMTDDAGRYVIRGVHAGQLTVRAQRLGFAASEQRVTAGAGETATVNFMMRAVATVLSEVVVTGYGTTSRALITSSVAQVSAEAIANTPVAGIDAALQGKAPGVQVVQNAGNPGNGITVRVRGAASLSASNQPLYVIDGVPMIRDDFSQIGFGGQDLSAVTGISPDEIESIDIMKDASASAIYGSRASNGVIQISTKRGRAGRTRFSFNAYGGQQKVIRKIELLSGAEYVEFMNEAAVNAGFTPEFDPATQGQINSDWQAAVLRSAPVSDINMAVNGGNDRVTYMLSGSYFNQEGTVIGSSYDRVNSRFNADFSATNRLAFRTSLGVSRENWLRTENDNTIVGTNANAIAVQPFLPIRRADGSFTSSDDGLQYANPVALGTYWRSPANAHRFLGNVEANYDATDRIRITGRVGGDVYSFGERRWESPLTPDTYSAGAHGVSRQGTNLATRYLAEGFATYEPLRAEAQRVTLTAGSGIEYNRSELTYIRGEGFGSNFFQYPGAAGKVTDYDGAATTHNLVSFFGRANYSFRDRYLVSASIRADGSSRFGENNRYGVFPSASIGWVASDEPMLAALKRFADLKVRASYGVTGNQDIVGLNGTESNFAFLGYYEKANFAGEPGIAPSNFRNPDLRWETTKESDFGFDLSFLGGRVALIGDYYVKTTSDLLVRRPISGTSGFTSWWSNVGNIENKGVELQLSATPVQAATAGSIDWRVDFNISHNKNRVTRLYNHEPFNSGIDDINRVQEGQPLGAFHTVRFLGVDPQTGDAIYDDVNGDGDINSDDRVIVGNPHPDYWGGVRNQFSWKGFDLNTFFEFSQGADIYNGIRSFADDGGYYYDNKIKNVLKRWQQPGDKTDVPRADYLGASGGTIISSRYVENGSYVRFQELTLGYRLPSEIAGRAKLSDARVFVSGRNLKVWSDFLGYDPDVNSNGSSARTSLGTEFYSYPRARTISIGVSGNW